MIKDPLLQVSGLKVHYPITKGLFRNVVGTLKAVDGIDLTLLPQEVLGIVGETGSGKTTLGRAILRLVEPTEGSIVFDGKEVRNFNSHRLKLFRKEAQIVFQDPLASLNPRKTIYESIGSPLRYHGIVGSDQAQRNQVGEVLAMVGLPQESMWRYPHQFSGGQQQRICIGRAIALRPRLIVFDEALSALDLSVQAQILNLLQQLKKTLSLSYLFISHDLSLIKYICDRVMVLYLGKVMETASVNSLFSHPCHPYTQALLAAIPKNHPLEKKEYIPLKGEIPSAAHPPSGCPFRTRCPYAQPICALTPPEHRLRDDKSIFPHIYHCILDPK